MNEGNEIPSGDELVSIVQLHLKPERVDDWKRAVIELIDRMSQEDAFVTCLLDQSTEDPNMFTLSKRGREPSLEAFVRNQMKDYRKRYEEMLPDLLHAPRKAMILRQVRGWHR
jgi:quinol monooxygenase YgiN